MRQISIALAMLALFVPTPAPAKRGKERPAEEKQDSADKLKASTFAGLKLRAIGPALTSGRVVDIAIHPEETRVWYVATAGGGVWKTKNAGITWDAIFDGEGSHSIGAIAIDPNNPHTVWVGTGENNSQRSVAYGDGVYRSLDGGKSFQRVGLDGSEHIGKIVIDPRDSNMVYVAVQGPLWSSGGDRGLYKTTDGGANWELVLEISEHTGITDLVMDPRDPDVLVAASYQRRRRVWTLINGGPESAIHKSIDGGKSWRKITRGLPKGDVGRIGLAISPADPDVLYAVIEAADQAGFYRSTDRGESWEKRSSYISRSPQYYQELIADPENVDRVYSNDVLLQVTEDGGSTFERVPETHKHVDNHALWIDPDETDHLIAGCDGGVYETWDRGANWRYVSNLSITQFYKVEVDNDRPFYNIYGGTQDNYTLGGPSRTISRHGITNADWYVTVGGDGFQPRVDPENPDIVYSQSQHGQLIRFDRRSGETVEIQPQPAPGEDASRWNWDSPLIISSHSPTRLYFASQRLYRSDDRGHSWKAQSGDLTRQLDRDQLEVMGKIWSVDSVSKNRSTSAYGNIVSLSESPLVEGLLYVGTDDGLIQVREPNAGNEGWRRIESFPGVPELTYVNDIAASQHAPDTFYAVFNNHKSGDFKPYLLKSTDRGATFSSIVGDLPERGSIYAVVEDPVKEHLLFVGTEFGAFFTLDGGRKWIELTGNMPTVAVRDLAIQKRENDLVLATFGRGFYVLDDLTPLRHVVPKQLQDEAKLFPVKDAWIYNESSPLGGPGKSYQGDAFFSAPNPPAGAVFTYYLADSLDGRRKARKKVEKELEEKGEKVPYPSWNDLRAEAREEAPAVILTVRDTDGHVIRRIEGPTGAGMHRVSWDLRFPPSEPVRAAGDRRRSRRTSRGPRVVPDTYQVSLSKRVDGVESPLADPQEFKAVPLGLVTLPASDDEELLAFQRKAARLQRAVLGAAALTRETTSRLDLVKKAVFQTAGADLELRARARKLELHLQDISALLVGDPVLRRHYEPQVPSIQQRVSLIVESWASLSGVTQTQIAAYEIAATAFEDVLGELRQLVEEDLSRLELDLEAVGVPWTPGRLPRWERE